METWSWLRPACRSHAQHPAATLSIQVLGFARLPELRFFMLVSASGCIILICLS